MKYTLMIKGDTASLKPQAPLARTFSTHGNTQAPALEGAYKGHQEENFQLVHTICINGEEKHFQTLIVLEPGKKYSVQEI